MNTFLSLLVTALQLKVAILGLPVEQQTLLTPTIDTVISSIQEEINKPQEITQTPTIETPVQTVTEPVAPVTFGSVAPANKLKIKVADCKEINADYKYSCYVVASLTTDKNGTLVGNPIKISSNTNGLFVNYAGPNFISSTTQEIIGKSHRFSFNYISGYEATYLTNEIPQFTAQSGDLTDTFVE